MISVWSLIFQWYRRETGTLWLLITDEHSDIDLTWILPLMFLLSDQSYLCMSLAVVCSVLITVSPLVTVACVCVTVYQARVNNGCLVSSVAMTMSLVTLCSAPTQLFNWQLQPHSVTVGTVDLLPCLGPASCHTPQLVRGPGHSNKRESGPRQPGATKVHNASQNYTSAAYCPFSLLTSHSTTSKACKTSYLSLSVFAHDQLRAGRRRRCCQTNLQSSCCRNLLTLTINNKTTQSVVVVVGGASSVCTIVRRAAAGTAAA